MSKVILYLVVFVVLEVIVCAVFSLMWGWVIPDVFEGAVRQDILPESLSLWQSFKLTLFLVLFVVGTKGTGNNS